uniref:Uncharacterized protein n=1 Tax=Romanomermis culicivorax TaxID=13658 RepID=A0A915KMH1_ROMCU
MDNILKIGDDDPSNEFFIRKFHDFYDRQFGSNGIRFKPAEFMYMLYGALVTLPLTDKLTKHGIDASTRMSFDLKNMYTFLIGALEMNWAGSYQLQIFPIHGKSENLMDGLLIRYFPPTTVWKSGSTAFVVQLLTSTLKPHQNGYDKVMYNQMIEWTPNFQSEKLVVIGIEHDKLLNAFGQPSDMAHFQLLPYTFLLDLDPMENLVDLLLRPYSPSTLHKIDYCIRNLNEKDNIACLDSEILDDGAEEIVDKSESNELSPRDELAPSLKAAKFLPRLETIAKVSKALMTVEIFKDMVGALMRKDYKTFALNTAFLASGPLLEVLSMKMVAKGASLDGGLLSRSLLISAPFLGRLPIMGFVGFDLYEQVKAYKQGNKGAMVNMAGDSAILTIDFATASVEGAEALGLVAGVADTMGPIGFAIGTAIFIGVDIYDAAKTVSSIDAMVHLTGWQKFTTGFFSFLHVSPTKIVQKEIFEKTAADASVDNAASFFKNHPFVKYYIFPSYQQNGDFVENNIIDLTTNVTKDRIVSINEIHSVIGRLNGQDTIICDCNTEYVDSQGGTATTSDVVIFRKDCFYNTTVNINGVIKIKNEATRGNFQYIVRYGFQAAISAICASDTNHKFAFEQNLEDLNELQIRNVDNLSHCYNITFKSDASSLLRLENIQQNSVYIFDDGSELVINNGTVSINSVSNDTVLNIYEKYVVLSKKLNAVINVYSTRENISMLFGGGMAIHHANSSFNNHINILSNDPYHNTYLIGGENQNLFHLSAPQFYNSTVCNLTPMPTVTIIDYADNDYINVIDFYEIILLIQERFFGKVMLKLETHSLDLLMRVHAECPGERMANVINVTLKKAFENGNYKRVVVNMRRPMTIMLTEISTILVPADYKLQNETYVVIHSGLVEPYTTIVSPKAIGKYNITVYNGNDLILTNLKYMDRESDATVMILKDFHNFKELHTLRFKFVDQVIRIPQEINELIEHDGLNDFEDFLS